MWSPPFRQFQLPQRSLLKDFVLLHLGLAALVGALAIGGLWWTSHWVIQENLEMWAAQWADRLEDLGTPLYYAVGDEELDRVAGYVASFPEIAFVRYRDPDGELFHELRGERYPGDGDESPLYFASTELWAESIVNDGLIGFDLQEGGEQERTLLGQVELGLDFDHYRDTMSARVLRWSLFLLLGLSAMLVAGLLGVRRALDPLRRMREPLDRLARGELDLPVGQAEHAEVAAINDALASTLVALHQRDRQLRQEANFDALTGLMGRRGIQEALATELEQLGEDDSSALLFIDLDQFKNVNDSAGHAAGDRLLVRVSALLQRLTGEEDLLCRFGGDEFLLLHRGADRAEAEQYAAGLIEAMGDVHFVEDGRAFNVRCSIGVAMVTAGGPTPEELVARADMACHDAKGKGRNCFRVFADDEGEATRLAEGMGWSDRIREALENDLFSLRFQPIVGVGGAREVQMYEVLLRMQGPGGELVPPGAFLPAAERFGQMGDLDFWVMRNALAQLAAAREEDPDLVFALNLSGIAFSDDRLVAFVAEQLDLHGLPGEAVVFEITEQVAVRFIEEASEMMHQLIALGCQFALDDFGAGFSSFNYLKRLPVAFLKIDGSFVESLADDPADRAIVSSIAQLAQAMGTRTVAEHVPDDRTMVLLAELGIDFAQGYHLGEPSALLAGAGVVARR